MAEVLINQALCGEQEAVEALFRRHYPQTVRLAAGLLNSQSDAEEVAQDALVYALTHLDRYQPSAAAFTTWLYMITVSRCRSRQRRKRLPTVRLSGRLGQEADEHLVIPDARPGPEESVERSERDAALWAAVTQLSAKQREAVVLRYAAGLTFPQMAQVLGCSASVAQSRSWLGERKLRELLSDLAPDRASTKQSGRRRQAEMRK